MPASTENKITEDTYIRHLPYSSIRYLSSHLDPDQLWKRFVIHVPKKLDSQNFQERYSSMQVKLFEEKGMKHSGSPTRSIIDDWGTQNARVKHLLKALVEGELYAAADHLSIKILNKGPVPRKTTVSMLPSHSEILPDPPTFSPAENIDCRDEKKYLVNKDISELTGQNLDDDIRMASLPSYGVYPSKDVLAEPPPRSLSVNHSNHKLKNSEKDLKNLPEIFPKDKIQEFSYQTLSLISNSFDDRHITEGGRIIGSGGFGKVYLGIPSNGYKVAIKTLKSEIDFKKDGNYEAMMIKQFQTELQTLSEYKHENIVPFIGFSVDDEQKCLVYQYMENGSLEDRLACMNDTRPLSWELRVKICHGTAEGIVYLNNHKLVHRDIKSANVLLDENFSPKVGDFATVRVAPSGTGLSAAMSTQLVIGTSAYMAPEAPRFDISAKLDSFAFGIVLLELLTGLPPLDDTRSESDLLSFIEENCDEEDISEFLDIKAGDWDTKIANSIFKLSQMCVENKKKDRALVSDILPELEKLVKIVDV